MNREDGKQQQRNYSPNFVERYPELNSLSALPFFMHFSQQVFITSTAVLFCFIGLVGNSILIAATILFKQLHYKICYIIAVLSAIHIVCLMGELHMAVFQIRFQHMKRNECFHYIFIYAFAIFAQSTMFFTLWMDFLLAISIPLRHRLFNAVPYVLTMCAPPLVVPVCLGCIFIIYMDEEEIDFCSPIQVIPAKARWILYVLNIKNAGALILNIVIFAVVKKKRTDPGIRSSATAGSVSTFTADVKLARSLLLLVWVFLCSWCTAMVLALVAVDYLSEEHAKTVKTYIVLLALPTYCQGFFVTYSRSARYRRVYKDMLHHIVSKIFCQNLAEPRASDISAPPNTKAEVPRRGE